MSINEKIHELFFNNHVVKFREGFEGQTCEGNVFVLGDRVGPENQIFGILHEIGHFAEREKEKLKKFPTRSWGFYHGKYQQYCDLKGRLVHYFEPSTDQQVQREARVFAYQLSAHKHFGLNDSAWEMVDSAVYLPAWCYYKNKYQSTGDQKAIHYLSKHVERLSKNWYTFDKLVEEYNSRVEYLKQYQ